MLRRRHRTGPYPIAQAQSPLRSLLWLVPAVVAVALLFWAGKALLHLFDFGNAIQRTAVILSTGNRGTVSVSLSGEEPRTADSELKLYPGDSVATDRGSPVALNFFDGSFLRLDRGGAVTIDESASGVTESEIAVSLERGTAWIRTPQKIAYSGAIVRTVATPRFTASIPSGAEVLLSPENIEVYSADGAGVVLDLTEADETVVIGEGQRYVIPGEDEDMSDPYAYRAPLANVTPNSFVLESRALVSASAAPASDDEAPVSSEVLAVRSPEEGSTVRAETVSVDGAIGSGVEGVRVNGYRASVDAEERTFSIEISLPDAEEIRLTVEALDGNDTVLAQVLRTVRRDRTPPEKPTVLTPSGDGSVYRTAGSEIEIRGRAPAGTAGIIVNDYRLQLFQAGDDEWSYLASTRLDNFHTGENIYRIVAVSGAGYRSDPAVVTIILGEGEEGVIQAGSAGSVSSTTLDPNALPDNAPLKPGTLAVTAPSAGTRHEAELTGTGAEFLIEGTVPAGTASVWVNDYQLRLFSPGKTFFNYIASTALNTLKRGSNPYIIVVRDSEGRILDRLEYTIVLTVKR